MSVYLFNQLLAIIAMVVSLLTLASFVKVFHSIFMGPTLPEYAEVKEAPLPMLLGMGLLAAIVILFGLHTLGIIHIPFLDMDTRRQVRPDPRLGYLSSALMGVFFSAGWSPCVGPVLGAVLTLALNASRVTQAAVLRTAYSAGLAIPFLLAALGIGRVPTLMRQHARLLRGIPDALRPHRPGAPSGRRSESAATGRRASVLWEAA